MDMFNVAECPDPATCEQCKPLLAKRKAFYSARGEERARLRAALEQARREDAAARSAFLEHLASLPVGDDAPF